MIFTVKDPFCVKNCHKLNNCHIIQGAMYQQIFPDKGVASDPTKQQFVASAGSKLLPDQKQNLLPVSEASVNIGAPVYTEAPALSGAPVATGAPF